MPANVQITIATFKDINQGKMTAEELKVDDPDNLVSPKADPNNKKVILLVKNPKSVGKSDVSIIFTVIATDDKNGVYYPVGIAYLRPGSSTPDQQAGFGNFDPTKHRSSGTTFTIVDGYTDSKTIQYKFSLLVQNGFNGGIGIIDPIIEHDPALIPPVGLSSRRRR